MSDVKDVAPIRVLTGMTVLSLTTGNKLGRVLDLLIDPINGVLLGVTLTLADGGVAGLAHGEIYSFGRDAVMVRDDHSTAPLDAGILVAGQPASKLIGTKIITESGDMLGQITNVFVTLRPPPHILYEARQSILDKLLGREFYIPASVGHALSDDSARLVVPDITSEIAASDLESLLGQHIEVRTFEAGGPSGMGPDNDDTILVRVDEDETLVRFGDDEDTILRREPTGS